MAPISFKAPLSTIGSSVILKLPKSASSKLPSRGMAMAEGTINRAHFTIPLEPDGRGSHWFYMTKEMSKKANVKEGDTVTISMESTDDWPEPTVPADIKKAITANPQAQKIWKETTVLARWDWIRWIRATNNPDTRAKRIKVACSKMKAGEKRPCCFNRSMCTDPSVSKGGVLL